MDDEVEVVEQNPAGAVAAFDMCGFHAFGAERFLDCVGDGVNLPRVVPCHDHEVVGEPFGRTKVEHDDVRGLAILAGVDGALHLRGQFF